MKRYLVMLLAVSSVLSCSFDVCATVNKSFPTRKQIISDDTLLEIATEKKIVPEEIDDAYVDKQVHEKNTVNTWIIMPHDEKIKIIHGVKESYSKNGVIIRSSDGYYVNEINGVIYNSIESGDMSFISGKGLGSIFKAVSVMDGDYDNGKDKVELAKETFGPEIFEYYKHNYPEKYEKLRNNK